MRNTFMMAALVVLMPAAGFADEFGRLNPDEGGLDQLAEDLALHPDRAGSLCWIAYEIQKGGGPDAVHAAQAMQLCADSGNAPSMILLAHAYEDGAGVEKSDEMSTHWVRRAAVLGYSMGQYHYAMALLHGKGIAADRSEARRWFEIAAENGSDDAAQELLQLGGS